MTISDLERFRIAALDSRRIANLLKVWHKENQTQMSQSLFTCPIVGAHFRPPAKQLLTVLPLGCQLGLEPEPDNPYDENAVKVLVSVAKTYPVSQWPILATALQGTGYEPQDLIDKEAAEGPLHIGYIPKSGAKTAQGGPGNAEIIAALAPDWQYSATLGVAAEGHPVINITARR